MIPYRLSPGYTGQGQSRAAREKDDSFARLMDVSQQDAQEYQIKIEQLQSRIADYENMTIDLERRLEEQALLCMKAENEAILAEKKWARKFEEITKEVDEWKRKCQKESEIAESVRSHLNRTERELYGILQKKHQILRGAASGPTSSTWGQTPTNAPDFMPVSQMFKSGGINTNRSPGLKKEIDKRSINSIIEFLGLK